jgi:thiol-disulfide isomerase/thioredoxin
MKYAILLTIAMVTMGNVPSLTGQEIDRMGALPPRIDTDGGPDLHTAEVDLFDKRTSTAKEVTKAYPILAKTDAVIVVFGAEWCTACKRQVLELKGPSNRYNVLVYDVAKEVEKLAELLKIGRSIPVVMVLEKGEPTKTFIGYTPWTEIKPHAKKAVKNEQKGSIIIGPIRIDWDLDGYDSDQYRRRRN